MSDQAPPLAWAWGEPPQRRAWKRFWIDDVVMGLRELGLHMAMRALPIAACSALGAQLGPLLGPLDPKSDARARKNLALLMPQASEAELEAARKRMWANVGRSMAEFSVLPRLWTSDRVEVHGLDNLQRARATGRPLICAAVHLGNWELVGPTLLRLGYDGVEFFQPPRNRFQRAVAERTRRRYADRLIAAGEATAAVRALRALKRGQGLVIFIDDFSKGRVNGPALGRPFNPNSSLGAAAAFARTVQAVVIPAFVLRRKGATFELHIRPHVDIAALPVEEAMRTINDALEPVVREHADQWYMLHELRDL